jgi:hypothetical protein
LLKTENPFEIRIVFGEKITHLYHNKADWNRYLAELTELKKDDFSFHYPEIPEDTRWLYQACAHCEHDIWMTTYRRKDLNKKSKTRKIKFFKEGKQRAVAHRMKKVVDQQTKLTKGNPIAPPGSSLTPVERQVTSAVNRMYNFFSGP